MKLDIYQLRINPHAPSKRFTVTIDDRSHHKLTPHFWIKADRFELVACANPEMVKKVFVITAPKSIVTDYANAIYRNIVLIYGLLFFPFLWVGYILARVALSPIKTLYESLLSFNADVIHDLKTPITTIGLNIKMIENSKSKPIHRINNAIDTLKDLYSNLETYLRTGEHLKYEQLSVLELISTQISHYTFLYPEVIFSIEGSDILLYCDKISIVRIIDNIIVNAIKYGGSPIPHVTITLRQNTLLIQDNGPGIKNPDKIFDRHHRECFYTKGYGLGLNIVRTLADRLNITIDVHNTAHEGSIFSLQLDSIVQK